MSSIIRKPDCDLKGVRLSQPGRLSQAKIAEVLNVTQGTYSKMESGVIPTTVRDLLVLARFYGIHPGDFFPGWRSKTFAGGPAGPLVDELRSELKAMCRKLDRIEGGAE